MKVVAVLKSCATDTRSFADGHAQFCRRSYIIKKE
jgi:hypothetical protein